MPIHSPGDILAALREHPEWKKELLNAFLSDPVETEEIRNRLLSREWIELPGKFALAEESRKSDVHTLLDLFQKGEEARRKDSKAIWEAIGRLTERVDRLTIRMDQLIEQVSKLAERTEIHEVSIADLTGKFLEFNLKLPMAKARSLRDAFRSGRIRKSSCMRSRRTFPESSAANWKTSWPPLPRSSLLRKPRRFGLLISA
jgi:hypothetical protein